ncbi:MAG: hypothetical protein IJC87_03350 [Clostridia bacterium]|nr:hypothetical protein [Clostridia bacterium]
MKAYQLIYTGCGKNKTGDFSVWSQSSEITKEESFEIVKMMSYTKARNTPYEIPEGELDKYCPVKYGCFTLSTGRKCIAQSRYIGPVYSVVDQRQGNFIIHAYVLDDLTDVYPFSVPFADIFKKELTYSEWHDNPAPDSLPAVEISLKPMVNDGIIKAFMSNERNKNVMASILQAVINCTSEDKSVSINGTEDEQKAIYAILGILLPSALHSKVTFANQYSARAEFVLAANNFPPIKVKNFLDGNQNFVCNYQDKVSMGEYAFSLDHGIFADVKPSLYASDLVETLAKNGLFPAIKRTEEISKVMKDLNCDADTAVLACLVKANQFNAFNSAEEYKRVFDLLLSANYIDRNAFAGKLYEELVLGKRWQGERGASALVKFAYQNSPIEQKDAIIWNFLHNTGAFGVSPTLSPKEFLNSVKANAPFDYNDLAPAFCRGTQGQAYLASAKGSSLYLMLDVLCQVMRSPNAQQVIDASKAVLSILKKAIADRDLDSVKLYFEKIQDLGKDRAERLITDSISTYLNATNLIKTELKIAFAVILLIEDVSVKTNFIATLLRNNYKSGDFLDAYLEVANGNKAVFENVERALKNDPSFRDFFIRKEAYVFKNVKPVTESALNDFFTNFYLKGLDDNGIFIQKFEEFILGLQGDQLKLKKLLERYEKIARIGDDFADVKYLLRFIEQEIYSLDGKLLLNLSPAQSKQLTEINDRLSYIGPNWTSGKYEVLNLVRLLTSKQQRNDLLNAIKQNTLFTSLKDAQIKDFADNYYSSAIESYAFAKSQLKDADDALKDAILSPLTLRVRPFEPLLRDALEHLGGNDYFVVMTDLLRWAFNGNEEFNRKIKSFVESYVESLGRGDAKKLFSKAKSIMEPQHYANVEGFVDNYLENHRGFFEKLFGKKKQ